MGPHGLVDAISFSLEKKLFALVHFLMCLRLSIVYGLLYKLIKFLHPTYFLVIKSYLFDRRFQIRFGEAITSIANIYAGVPRGGVLSPIPYNIYVSDQIQRLLIMQIIHGLEQQNYAKVVSA